MRIRDFQVNNKVGGLEGKLSLGNDAYEQLCGQGVDLVVFPELFLCGYPPRDLLYKENFLTDTERVLQVFARQTGPTPALIGYAEKDLKPASFRKCFNSAAWCVEGKIDQVFRKRLLPTYDVFDEDRYFSPGNLPMVLVYKNKKIAITICEDIWNVDSKLHSENPLQEISREKPDLLLNLSASRWHQGKQEQRIKLLSHVDSQLKCPLSYVNAVGGNDELIFDGCSSSIGTH